MIAEARHRAVDFLTRVQAEHGLPVSARAMDLTQLVVSELVTNARKYAPGLVLMELRVIGAVVEVVVWDSDPVQFAAVREVTDDIGTQVAAPAADDNLRAAVPAAQISDVSLEFLPGQRVDLRHRRLTGFRLLQRPPLPVLPYRVPVRAPQPPAAPDHHDRGEHGHQNRPHRRPVARQPHHGDHRRDNAPAL
ncbi:hypothetical protein GCM10027074_69520 [Streptomyces deserti]